MTIPASANPLLLKAGGGYAIERSLRFNSADSTYLSKSFASAGNRKTWTWAGWVKLAAIADQYGCFLDAGITSGVNNNFRIHPTGVISFRQYNGSTQLVELVTTQLFRDYSAWYHLVLVYDSSNATSSDRVRLYVNGERITAFATATYPSFNLDSYVNSTYEHRIGTSVPSSSTRHFDGYLADIHFIDDQALDPTSFGEFDDNGIWQPKRYSGTYGTNGFKLDFADNSSNTATTLGKDTSGNGNNWTPNNLSVLDGLTSVAAASGALPIYNTTDTYGITKGTGTRTDSNSSSIVLALPMDGANNGTTFTDESATIKGSGGAKSITRNGDTKTLTAQSKYYGSSGYFDGTGDWLSTPYDASLTFGSGDFTIEHWINPQRPAGQNSILCGIWDGASTAPQSWIGYLNTTGTYGFIIDVAGTDILIFTSSSAIPNNQWTHIAVTRSGNTWRLFIDGVLNQTTTNASSISAGSALFLIGTYQNKVSSDYTYTGYIQDLRIYKGVAKYTSNFNPPSSTQNVTIAVGNDSLVDVPTNGSQTDTGAGGEVRGNYCTWNPLSPLSSGATLSNGNLDVVTVASGDQAIPSTIFMSSGKWYCELTITTTNSCSVGIIPPDYATGIEPGNSADSYAYRRNQYKRNNSINTSYGERYDNGDVIGIALDLDNGTLVFYKNGVSQGTAFTGISGTFCFAFGDISGSVTTSCAANFGQRPFAYTVPSGFKTLNTANLPEGAITTSGTFTGNANADGPFVYLNGIPTAMIINGNAVTFATHADKLSNGFKLRTSSTSYNSSGSNTYSITTTGDKFKFARAQLNP